MPEIEEVVPKYLQISGYLRNQIERGELAAGAEVPSERELAASWKVARPTAAKALNLLRQQGVVESRRGSGTYVVDRSITPLAREKYRRAQRYGSAYAENASVTMLDVGVSEPPGYVAEVLRLPPGNAAIRRKRLATNESSSHELATSWFPASFAATAPRLLAADRLTGGPIGYLESATDHRVAHARDRVCARLATAEEREHLGLAEPAAVLVYELTLHDASGAVLEFDEVVFPPDSWMLQQEYSARS
ncbi:GntR family transcriptional regulator [Nocardia sp. NPDC052566]|uniref:GntR family transcriptional regulator n=1 Tax=Nocardia sp. NPDC052566 TaxID=3364330 RepID=UPI0037CBDE86